MDERLLKPYDPKETESKIYKLWEKSGFFNPNNLPERHKEFFSIVLPPPNVTGTLHLGHALEDSIQDMIVRYKRMAGFKTLWVPGTDHAAIATQSKVEKLLEKEGIRKNDIGREEFLKRVKIFAQNSHDGIISQIKKMGASLDWSREAFTLDEKRNIAVKTAFKQMYDDGLIYRGNRMVNWDPKGQTVISDDEIVYEEKKGKFYTFKYGPFEIGTARPETKFGDKYVVIHPDDKRYKDWKHMQKITVEWINGPIEATIIKDEMIDMGFGTGVMTITPWHSHEDFALAEKYKLDKEQIIDKYGKLLPIAGEFVGMKIGDAREKIVEKLKEKGLLVSVDENYVNRVATAERTGGTIEPQIMLQWFINVNKPIKERGNKTLKDLMREPIEKGEIKIIPEHFEKVYYHWIENLRDWCISRQIWYGHQIPVWYRKNEIYCGIEAPTDKGWEQDPDTLDTWFSSSLWTFSTLGWPEKTKDLKSFHPTSLINPGYEILFFWVARMILMSQFLIGEIPFKTVFLHGILRDKNGKKFSKSSGNNIDPVEIIEKYGADALRMSLISGTGSGNDSNYDENKVKGYKNFANKIWNITRFILKNIKGSKYDPSISNNLTEEFKIIVEDITSDMDNYRFHLAAEKIYQYIWHKFADEILEESKKIIKVGDKQAEERKSALLLIWNDCIKILHPFMPFVTEEIWSIIKKRDKDDLIMVAKWPFGLAQDKPEKK
ncbi:valine--tRNA ligase [Candidatus Nomurabacteria bacterium RIFCSPHIGHO2_02_FULL_35_13]|uniref:Valine--tRNA ligase n=1 Tax=Candidatus Nomurabacteria bacterium RIFCSPHIGHO2_02_FULL_35_13 TaxID=1801748 RepID=A0A1F6VQ03_9BACT|nr:MAG: valine--tRNA ligase [Candidatus Nomurabacteria bacterium RIFCSPHIGHO2_02_FULL_35_13]